MPTQHMHILPVIDLMSGQVVHGVAGERETYRPVESVLCTISEPLAVANAIREEFGFQDFYLADLDAITSGNVQSQCLEQLVSAGLKLHVDAGVCLPGHAKTLLTAGAQSIIIGLETLVSPSQIEDICEIVPQDQLMFSLDMRSGRPITAIEDWQTDPNAILQDVLASGISKFVLLDLHDVGSNQGLSTLDVLQNMKQNFPQVEFIIGGGIRHSADLHAAQAAGANAVLVASALHSGQLRKSDLLPFLR